MIFIPLIYAGHISLTVIDFKARTICYFDSYFKLNPDRTIARANNVLSSTVELLAQIHRDKGVPFENSQWGRIHARKVPTTDGFV